MKWKDTTASQCRYGGIAGKIWSKWDIIWEDSEADYQGHASILAKNGNEYCFYEWWYGSCSGCDGWEAEGRTNKQIEEEMRKTAIWFSSKVKLKKWLGMLEGNQIGNYSMENGGFLAEHEDQVSISFKHRINAIRKELGIELLPIPKEEDEESN